MRLKIYKLRKSSGFAIRWYKSERWLEITLWGINIVIQLGGSLQEQLDNIYLKPIKEEVKDDTFIYRGR